MPVAILALVSIAFTANFTFNVFSSIQKEEKGKKIRWNLFPLQKNQRNDRKLKKSIWNALSEFGRMYYSSTTHDMKNDQVLYHILDQLYSQSISLKEEKRLELGFYVFSSNDLWEGDTLYQFLQGLNLIACEKQNKIIEIKTKECLEYFYDMYADCLNQERAAVVA